MIALDPDIRLWDCEIAAVDVETTGLDAEGGDRVIEVAVARGGPAVAGRSSAAHAWSTLLDPGRPVGATHIHGITDAMVAGQPRFAAVVDALEGALEGAVVVAHNASFDVGFLRCEYARAERAPAQVQVYDTLAFARRAFALSSNSLDSLCAHFRVERARAHRAADDALATLVLLWRMLEVVDPERTLSLGGFAAACRRRSSEELLVLRSRLLEARAAQRIVRIEYLSHDGGAGERTLREITVREVRSDRVVAFCHLRAAERTFRLDRLRLLS